MRTWMSPPGVSNDSFSLCVCVCVSRNAHRLPQAVTVSVFSVAVFAFRGIWQFSAWLTCLTVSFNCVFVYLCVCPFCRPLPVPHGLCYSAVIGSFPFICQHISTYFFLLFFRAGRYNIYWNLNANPNLLILGLSYRCKLLIIACQHLVPVRADM